MNKALEDLDEWFRNGRTEEKRYWQITPIREKDKYRCALSYNPAGGKCHWVHGVSDSVDGAIQEALTSFTSTYKPPK